MQAALQNLSVEGLPISMNEFGMSSTTNNQTLGPAALDNAMRMIYGNPLANTFMIWGWWNTFPNNVSAQLVVTQNGASNYTLTAMGQQWVNDMNAFTTPTQAVTVNPDGTINFNGYYGEYALQTTVNGQTYTYATVDFEKGPNNTPLETLWVKGDFNLDGKLTEPIFRRCLARSRT